MTKPTKWHVCPVKTDQPGHMPSLRCPHEESLGPQLPIERTAKIHDQAGRTVICWFCHEAAQLCNSSISMLSQLQAYFCLYLRCLMYHLNDQENISCSLRSQMTYINRNGGDIRLQTMT